MKTTKESTVKKSVRIPTRVAEELIKDADNKFNSNFSDAVVYRLQHFQCPLTPAIVGKIQNIVNLATDPEKAQDPQKQDEMQKEVLGLWNYLK